MLEVKAQDKYLIDPDSLYREVTAFKDKTRWVVIDEIQKVPRLLDVVHRLIEGTSTKFCTSGSSAKKLKAGGANLLAGRAFNYNLYPLSFMELGESFELDTALAWGTLPKLLSTPLSEAKERYLETYALTYLREEVWNEHLIRALEPFRKFIEVAAQSSGNTINFAKIAGDVGVDEKTVKSYFSILEETLLGFFLEPYHTSVRKRQRQQPKFYFFDVGVMRAIEKTLHIPIGPRTYGYGRLFEHFIIQEMHRLNEYSRKKYSFYFLRVDQGDANEIDLIIERPGMPIALVEIKSTDEIKPSHVETLAKYKKDFKNADAFCLSKDYRKQVIDGVECLGWQDGLRELELV